jgi:hypothetical protein
VALRHRDESGRNRSHLTVRRATPAPGGTLVAALVADVDDIASVGALLGAPVVRSPEVVERRGFGSKS